MTPPLFIVAEKHQYAENWARDNRLKIFDWKFLSTHRSEWDRMRGYDAPVIVVLGPAPQEMIDYMRACRARVLNWIW
jgi:hypothetical protein